MNAPDACVKLVCGCGMSIMIAAIFNWKPRVDQDAAALEQIVDCADDIPPVDIALTLAGRHMPRYGNMSITDRWPFLDTSLAQEAFRCKTYTIRLEKGTFPIVGRTAGDGYCYWYSLRLHFEPSPYPPLEEWSTKRPADLHKYWERKDFYRQEVEGDIYYDPETGTSRREQVEQLKVELARKWAR